jgi:hypothetical protein
MDRLRRIEQIIERLREKRCDLGTVPVSADLGQSGAKPGFF